MHLLPNLSLSDIRNFLQANSILFNNSEFLTSRIIKSSKSYSYEPVKSKDETEPDSIMKTFFPSFIKKMFNISESTISNTMKFEGQKYKGEFHIHENQVFNSSDYVLRYSSDNIYSQMSNLNAKLFLLGSIGFD